MNDKEQKKDFSKTSNTDVWERKWKEDPCFPVKTIKRELSNEFAKVAIADMQCQGFKKILELGPGAGRDTAAFVEGGFEVIALEISKSGADRLKEEFPNALIMQADIREAELPNNLEVDAVYAFSVLHYFNDPELEDIYKTLSSRLNDNGRLYIALRSVDDEMSGKGQKVEENTFIFNDAKRRFFSNETVEKMLNKNGFEVISLGSRSVEYHAHDDGHLSTFIEVIAKKKCQLKAC